MVKMQDCLECKSFFSGGRRSVGSGEPLMVLEWEALVLSLAVVQCPSAVLREEKWRYEGPE